MDTGYSTRGDPPRDQSTTSVGETATRFDREEQGCLFEVLCDALGYRIEWTPQLKQIVTALVAGFGWLARSEAGKQWHLRLSALLRDQTVPIRQAAKDPTSIHQLAAMLERRPAAISASASKACFAAGAITLAYLVDGGVPSEVFLEGLGFFVSSGQPHWTFARAHVAKNLLTDAGLCVDANQFKPVVARFLRSLEELWQAGLKFPPLFRLSSGHADAAQQVATAAEEAKRSAEDRRPAEFKVDPAANLFEFQTVQQEHEPALNSYRDVNDWNSLAASEFMDCGRILVEQLRTSKGDARHRQKRLHAACRLLAMEAELSLEQVARLPLRKFGSMYLDLQQKCLIRDLNVVAPRHDRAHRANSDVSEIRTPVPPEVMAVIDEAVAEHGAAESIGDLLTSASLTPTICHRLLNHGRTESRVFDSLRVARSLRTFLLRADVHPSVISRALGDITVVPRSQHYYLLLEQKMVHDAINKWCRSYGLIEVVPPDPGVTVGSPKALPLEEIARWFAALENDNRAQRFALTPRSTLREYVRFSNDYIARSAAQIGWSFGGRLQNLSQVTSAAAFADAELMLVGDRVSDRYAALRACVKSAPIQETTLRLIEHISTLASMLAKRGHKHAAEILRTNLVSTSATAYAFPIIYKDKKTKELMVRPCTRRDIQRVTQRPLKQLNAPRHFLITEFVRLNVSAVAIDALVGHHQAGAPPFGVGSGISIAEFATYIRPVLAGIHERLGIKALGGLGRRQLDRLKLPVLVLPTCINLPESKYLRQRVEIEDFNPPDILLAEEDCPVSPTTLACRSELTRLRQAYLTADAVRKHPRGAVLFCLIVFDAVIAPRDLSIFAQEMLAHGPTGVERILVVESFTARQDLPSGQRILSRHTVFAHSVAASVPTGEEDDSARELLLLIRKIDPAWPEMKEQECVARLQSMVSHAVLVDVNSIARFSLFHKAPFVPLSDMRRILTCNREHINLHARISARAKRVQGFKQISVVKDHADKDVEIGEYQKRAKLLTEALLNLEDRPAFDFADQQLNALLIAELSEVPPFRRIGLPLLYTYASIQREFFKEVRMQGRYPIGIEEWTPLLEIFRGEDGGHRWFAGRHLAVWLASKGVPVPPVMLLETTAKTNYAPHLSVLVTKEEIDIAGKYIRSLSERAAYEWTSLRLRMQRHMPFRPLELRYLKARHVSNDAQFCHVTSSGHDHLKTPFSRGLVSVPGELRDAVREHRIRRTASLMKNKSSLLIEGVDKDYETFDRITDVSRDVLRDLTGRADFRMYDLRANAVSDILLDVEQSIRSLADGKLSPPRATTARDFSMRFARGAAAASEARHTSVITPIRYYYLGGQIEIRVAMDSAVSSLLVGPIYVEAVGGKSAGAIYATRKRQKAHHKPVPAPQHFLPNPAELARTLGGTTPDPSSVMGPHAREDSTDLEYAKIVRAGLLALAGLPLKAACDDVGVAQVRVERSLLRARASLAEAGISALSPHTIVAKGLWLGLSERLSEWAVRNVSTLTPLVCGTSRAVIPERGAFVTGSVDFLSASRGVWAELKTAGVRAVFVCTRKLSASQRASWERPLREAGIELFARTLTRRPSNLLRFAIPNRESEAAKVSNHVLGKTGSLVVASVLLAVSACS